MATGALAWIALVGASALLIIAVKLIYDVPDDLRYRYSTVLFAIVGSALQLAVTVASRRKRPRRFRSLGKAADFRDLTAARRVVSRGLEEVCP